MDLLDIAIAKQLAGGGGSGTDNYNELSNLPKINGTTLSGDKSSSSLGLQSEIKEGAKLASNLVDDSESDNKFVTSAEKLEWSGKQDKIDGSNKLSSDYVDDTNKTNKFVTSTEKNTWNAKQNALTFDDAPTSGSNNPVKSGGIYTALSGKQDTIDSSHKLSSALVSFSTAQNAALSSGIDSTKVSQISTNQSNISSVEDMICATEFSPSTAYAVGDMVTYEHKLYKFINAHQGAWSASDVQNYDLTRLQAEDRAALAEEIDAGAKNKIKYDMAQLAALNPLWIVSGSTIRPSSDTHITFTLNSDMSIRVQSDGSNAQAELCICTSNYSSFKAGTYVLSGCPTGGNSSTTYDLRLIEQSSPKKYNADVGSTSGYEITWSAQYTYTCNIMVRANQNIDKTFKPMICTKAAFGVSNKFVPYRPPYSDISTKVQLSNQRLGNNATTFAFDISDYQSTSSNRYRYGLLIGGVDATHVGLYHVFIDASNNVTLTAVVAYGTRTLTASISGSTLTITADNTLYGGLRLVWLD